MMMKNKKRLKVNAFLAGMCAVSLFAAGCGGDDLAGNLMSALEVEETEATHTVYVVDQTKYAPKYDLAQLLGDTISDNYTEYGSTATVIRLDGDPKVVDRLEYEDNGKGGGSTWKEKDRQEAAGLVTESIADNTFPVADEVNVLKAWQLACDELGTYADGAKRIVIVSSMLQTENPLDMSGGLGSYSDESAIEETVTALNDIKEIPSMAEIDSVDIYGLGYTDTSAGEQAELTALDAANLEALWTAVFETGGISAENLNFHTNTPDGAAADAEYPAVTPVAVSETVVYDPTAEDLNLEEDILCLDDVSLSFEKNSAELLSTKDEALAVLAPVIAYAARDGARIAVFASTAYDDDTEWLYELSAARADTIKSLLVEAGVSEDALTCYALGYEGNPYKRACYDDEGNWDEESARLNRVVYITDAGSEAANVFYQNLDERAKP